MTFKKGVPVLGKPAKLPAPAHHQLVDGTEGLLGIAVVDQRSVLRAFAADGSVTRQRELSLGYLRPVRLAFEGESWLVGNEGPTVRWVTVSPDSSRATHDLFTLDEGEELYNIQIDTHDDCVALRFTTDRGPGFAFVRAGALVDAFRVDATGSAISRIGGDPISLGNGPQLVWGMKPCDHGYYVVTTPQVFHPEKATEFAVHRRVV